MTGSVLEVITEAGSTVVLICFGYLVVRWLARRVEQEHQETRALTERMLKAWGVPPEDPKEPEVPR